MTIFELFVTVGVNGYGFVVGYGIAGATERCEDLCVKWSVHGVRDCMIWKVVG